MLLKPSRPSTLDNKYNLFSKQNCITPIPYKQTHKENKIEIKLVFHHPNLLFLNTHKQKSKEDIQKEMEHKIINNIETRKKKFNKNIQNSKTAANKLSKTSFDTRQIENELDRCKTSNTEPTKNLLKKKLQIFGRSSKLNSENIEMNSKKASNFQTLTANISSNGSFYSKNCKTELAQNEQNLFNLLQKAKDDQKIQTWGEMWQKDGNKYAIRLNMYLDMEKKYQKYCHNRSKRKSSENMISLL